MALHTLRMMALGGIHDHVAQVCVFELKSDNEHLYLFPFIMYRHNQKHRFVDASNVSLYEYNDVLVFFLGKTIYNCCNP